MKAYGNGTLELPSSTNANIDTLGAKSAITREYLFSKNAINGGTDNYVLTNAGANTPTWELLEQNNMKATFIDQNLTT